MNIFDRSISRMVLNTIVKTIEPGNDIIANSIRNYLERGEFSEAVRLVCLYIESLEKEKIRLKDLKAKLYSLQSS